MKIFNACAVSFVLAAIATSAGAVPDPQEIGHLNGTPTPEYPLNGVGILDARVDPAYFDTFMGGILRPHNNIENDIERLKSSTIQNFGHSAAMGDFDGDGHMDLVICGEYSPNWKEQPGWAATSPYYPTPSDGALDVPRWGAGVVCVIYGPSENWEKFLSYRSTGSDLWNGMSNDPTYFNAFDLQGVLRYLKDSDENGIVGDATEESELENPRDRIPALVIYGRNGIRSAKPTGTDPYFVDNDDDYKVLSAGSTTASWTHGGQSTVDGFSIGLNYVTGPWNDVIDDSITGDLLGYSVSFLGDVDGYPGDELIIGSPQMNVDGKAVEHDGNTSNLDVLLGSSQFGGAIMLFGSRYDPLGDQPISGRITGVYDLDDITRTGKDGTNDVPAGVKFIGATWHDKVGQDVRNGSLPTTDLCGTPQEGTVVPVMDVNGDFHADILIGAQSFDSGDHPNYNPGDPNTTDAAYMNVSTGLANDPAGRANGIGACYIIYGAPRSEWTQDVYELPNDLIGDNLPEDGAVIYGSGNYTYLGYCGFGGDFDGNGCSDVIIGTPHEDAPNGDVNRSNVGAAYVVFGSKTNPPVGEYFTSMNTNGESFTGSLSSAVNKPIWRQTFVDAVDSETEGCRTTATRPRALKIRGSVNTPLDYNENQAYDANAADHWNVPPLYVYPEDQTKTQQEIVADYKVGAEFGWTVMAAGDVDADGKTDILVGAPDFFIGDNNDNDWQERDGIANLGRDTHGRAYLIYGFEPGTGSSSGFLEWDATNHPSEYEYIVEVDDLLSASNSITGTVQAAKIRGERMGDNFGWHVFCAGDLNADGHADFVIGANEADYVDNNSNLRKTVGAAYVIYGDDRVNLSGELSARDIGDSIKGAKLYGDSAWSDLSHFAEPGATAKPRAGVWVSGGQDLDGDGYPDLVVCSEGATMPFNYDDFQSPARSVGAVFIIYGGNIMEQCDFDMSESLDCLDLAMFMSDPKDLNHDGVADPSMTGPDYAVLESFISGGCP